LLLASIGWENNAEISLKVCLRIGTNISVQPLIINPGMSSSPIDLDGLKCLMALITSESETYTKVKNLEDDKRVGKTTGQRLLYTD
jgi:hypothetical protein